MPQNPKKGLVLRSHGKEYTLKIEENQKIVAFLKGNWRVKGLRTTNPIAVGDHVKYDLDSHGQAVIVELLPRKNTIVRKSIKLSKAAHVIASNVDQVVVVVTPDQPFTSFEFIDRVLVAIESYHIKALILIHKTDLKGVKKRIEELKSCYEKIGYEVILSSIFKGDSIQKIRKRLKDKISVIAGHSGVGKSSLINRVEPGLDIRTTELSDYHQMGKHTTTNAEMHPFTFGGYIIDTPGIKGFGLHNVEKNELSSYFPEMAAIQSNCKYYNCTHDSEPDCAIKTAVQSHQIAGSRYKSYLNMLSEDRELNYR